MPKVKINIFKNWLKFKAGYKIQYKLAYNEECKIKYKIQYRIVCYERFKIYVCGCVNLLCVTVLHMLAFSFLTQ
jgi:hypothetical protein